MAVDLKTAHKQFVEHLESRRRARATIVAYSKDIEQLVSFLGNTGKKDITEIKSEELAAFLKKLASEEYTEKVARNTLGLVKEGESIVILPGAGSRSGGPPSETERTVNWQKWWGLFF